MEKPGLKKRNDAIVKDYLAGNCLLETAKKHGLSYAGVYYVLTQRGVRCRTHREAALLSIAKGAWPLGPKTEQNERREEKIVTLVSKGLTFTQIARRLRITRNVVAGAMYRYRRRMERAEAA